MLRVEVLHPGSNPFRRYWRNRSGSVLLVSRAGGPWTAVVDRVPVMDEKRPDEHLSASRPEDLVHLLAMQADVHGLLDESAAWAEDASGWPVSLRATT